MNFEERMNEFVDNQRQKFEEVLKAMAKPRPEQLGRIPKCATEEEVIDSMELQMMGIKP